MGRQHLRCQGLLGNGQHVFGAFEKTAQFVAGLADRLAHLHGDVGGDGVVMLPEIVQPPAHRCHTLPRRHPPPIGKSLTGRPDLRFQGLRRVTRDFTVNRLVVWVDDLLLH